MHRKVRRRRFPINRLNHHYYSSPQIYFLPIILSLLILLNNSFLSFVIMPGETLSYKSFIDLVIPGLPEALPEEKSNTNPSKELFTLSVMSLINIDPTDPSTFVSSEVKGLGVANVSQINTSDIVGESDSPDIQPSLPSMLTNSTGRIGNEDSLADMGTIIVYHVHTTESFLPTSGLAFTSNLEESIVNPANMLVDLLEQEYNIPVIHDTTIHDIPRSDSYRKARETLKNLLSDTPAASLVIDLHRDGVAKNITTAEINGEKTGKILFVVGEGHLNWRNNYQISLALHDELEKLAPGISRGIKTKNLTYNQDLHERTILVEIGGHKNSLEEARRSIPYLAKAIARLYGQA